MWGNSLFEKNHPELAGRKKAIAAAIANSRFGRHRVADTRSGKIVADLAQDAI
jgi:hypothetical protein